MTTTIGSLDLNALSDLYNDSNQYFWFEGDTSATYGAGVHITLSPDTSFIANPTGQNILMNTDGISIRNGLLPMMALDNDSLDFNVINTTTGTYNNVASFGSTAIVIGEEAKANLHLTFNNLSMVDKDGIKFFEVGDTRNADGIATIKYTETTTVNGAGSAYITVNSNISSIVSVYADSVQLSSSQYSFSGKNVKINGLTADSKKTIKITYTTTESIVYLTFGKRDLSGNIGNYSVAEGNATTASGMGSHAEGSDTTASGNFSHAEGSGTTASVYGSHAEGVSTTASEYCSHAEGNATTASGIFSHAEGSDTTASEYCSHAGGSATVADGFCMTAIGKYNTLNSGKAFAIGNGADGTSRSDAFTVDWDGNTVMKGGLTLGTALSIANGGTGATTAAAARKNLGVAGYEEMAGEIKMWAGNKIPDGWLLCDGSEISKTKYPKLYAAIGNLWGTPNSSSNFKLPNLNGKVPVGYNSSDTDFDTVGKMGGEKTHTLTVDEIPSHRHQQYGPYSTGKGSSSAYTQANNRATTRVKTDYKGGGGAHNNLQPYAVVKYIIRAI